MASADRRHSPRPLTQLALCSVVAVILGPTTSAQVPTIENAHGRSSDATRLTSLLRQYCHDCHGNDTQEAGVRLDDLDLASIDDAAYQVEPSDGPSIAGQLRATSRRLERALQEVASRRMPPDDGDELEAGQRERFLQELDRELSRIARQARDSGVWPRRRRMTAEEYNYSMQSLFQIDASFTDMLPPDPVSETGYLNDAELLGISSIRAEAYLESARRAVDRYVPFEDNGPAIRYHIDFEDLFYASAKRYDTRKRAPKPVDVHEFRKRRAGYRTSPPKFADPLGPYLLGAHSDDEKFRAAIPKLNQQYVAIPKRHPIGELTIHVRAAGTADRHDRYPRMRVEAGVTLGDGCSIDKRLLGEVDVKATIEQPKSYYFRIRLEDVPTKGPIRDEDAFDQLSLFDMDQIFISNVATDTNAIFALGRGAYDDPEQGSAKIADDLGRLKEAGASLLHLDCIEIEMEPGAGRGNGDYFYRYAGLINPPSKSVAAGSYRGYPSEAEYKTAAERETAMVRLASFLRRAYRRPVTSHEVLDKLRFYERLRDDGYSFSESLKEAMAASLVSPSFLFIDPAPITSTDTDSTIAQVPNLAAHRLASRLSYFLWNGPPDPYLEMVAESGELLKPDVLRTQTRKMTEDPRVRRFLESFCRQWLRLDRLRQTNADRESYPRYDGELKTASERETIEFFVHVFKNDRSALDLIDADYAVLNNLMADHYGVPGVRHGDWREVALPKDSVRGGLLTQASVLTMNSNGVDSHPIRRGAWLLDRILHQPPPPPPPNVPDLDASDPSFAGLSLKEQIELHRSPGACRGCHQKIDPWGIPFETFDATGQWRTERGHADDGDQSESIDTVTVLPDGRKIRDVRELKRYLRQQRADDFARSMTMHLLTYGLGRKLDYLDRPAVESISQRFVDSGYLLRELVLAIVESPTFQE